MIKKLLAQSGWLLFFATLVSSGSALFGLFMIAKISEQVSNTSDSVSGWIGTFMLGLCCLFLLGVGSQLLLTLLSTRFVARLRTNIVANILRADYAELEKTGGHKLYAALTSDINNISAALSIFPVLVFNITSIVVCLIYLSLMSLELFAMLLGLLLMAVGTIQIVTDLGVKHFVNLREAEDGLFRHFKALIDGAKELCGSAARKHFFFDRLMQTGVNEMKGKERLAQLYINLSINWGTAILFFTIGGTVLAATAHFKLPMDTVAAYVFVLIYLSGPIGAILGNQQTLAKGRVGISKIEKLNLGEREVSAQVAASADVKVIEPAQLAQFEQLTARGVTYQYHNADEGFNFSVGPVDFDLKRGEIVFFIGGNGSGKSTFSKVLTGLYRNDNGDISVNGEAVEAYHSDWYRAHFATIHADCFVFDTVLNHQGQLADDEHCRALLQRLGLEHKVTIKNGQLSTTSLSSGQRKRLALLQAWLQDAPIFVFDEWAAEQDPVFRELFYLELLPELKRKNKAVIAISHDDRYFACADRIIRFEQGTAVEMEAPQSLDQ